ncbi:MAG: AAA domain protein [Faunusvirus sp.]|jgi:adenylate kinase family enzyme|uniref:AAA domain protein n=1 Tax=Faunusvirus sp. TaxID=2487766 RepID=A0A3G4ZW22_9VIRU|nr:MAG: AAA domain protein [Faunusvirus sp.]
MIIHISGAPGSGKTTLGLKFKKYLKNKVVVKDLDELFSEYMRDNKFNSNKYQKYIDSFIKENNNKPIIFVGLNSEHLTTTLYDVNSDYNFYINTPIELNLKRHFDYEIHSWLQNINNIDQNKLFVQLLNNEKDVIKKLTDSLEQVLKISNQKKYINSFDKLYKKKGYIFLTSDKIYEKVVKLLK